MITLNPSPRSLGLHSPVIGPWFSADSVTLPLPDADLAVALNLDGNVEWRPPAAGFLSFYVATATRPDGLARLRQADGNLAFTDGRLVAVFELLPQASERLAALMRAIPSLGTPAVAGQATRPPLRTFALEINATTLGFFTDKLQFGYPLGIDSDAAKLAYLGLASAGAGLGNAAAPMRDLFRPGVTAGQSQYLLKFPAATAVRLWVFDSRGRAVDPGAAACWWRYLATHADNGFEDLFAEGVDQRTAPITAGADRLTIQLVNPHEGPLSAETLARVDVGGNVAGTGALRHRGTDTGAVTLGFTTAPDPDDLPVPVLAAVPDGRFDASLSLFETGAVDPILVRDHVRVAVVSLEHHLTGQPRHAAAGATTPAQTRATDQARVSTRVSVDRATRPVLLRTADAIATTALEVLTLQDGTTAVPSRMAASALAIDWGPLTGTLADVDVPTSAILSAQALVGGGTADGATVSKQKALLTIELGAAAAGVWVRAWTQGFNHSTGERYRLDGGAGRADAQGRARIIVPLPDGATQPNAPLGADLLLVSQRGRQHLADQRFDRPMPVGGSPAAPGAATGPFLLCEEEREIATLDATTNIASGTTVIALGGTNPTIVDRTALPTTTWAAATWARAASANLTVRLTPPAFTRAPTGDTDAVLGTTGATVRRSARVLANTWQPGQPLAGMERCELVAAASTANVSRAVVGGGPALGDRHGLLPHHDGHPLCPAGPDVIAVGARVEGPGVRPLAEFLRERVSTTTVDLVTTVADADIAVPTAPTTDSLWVAGLRTVAAGIEAEVGLAQLLGMLAGSGYPFGQTLTQIRDALAGLGSGITIPANINDTAGRIARALDRRFQAAARGAREAATAIVAAIQRAEDLVWIETPALDHRNFGDTDDTLGLVAALRQRMTERPGLRVFLCVPVFFDAAVPKAFQRARDRELRAAIDTLGSGGYDRRIAVISPSAGPGRSLKVATTTVIVDDAWALVGTTHLWRRGLSFDSSYAVSVFDDRLEAGRPQELRQFRHQLSADRLGVDMAAVPDDPADLIDAARSLAARGGFGRLAAERLRPPETPQPTDLDAFTEDDVWNPDGSPSKMLTWLSLLATLPTAVSEDYATP